MWCFRNFNHVNIKNENLQNICALFNYIGWNPPLYVFTFFSRDFRSLKEYKFIIYLDSTHISWTKNDSLILKLIQKKVVTSSTLLPHEKSFKMHI
jgi:hypothetical protein